MSSETRTLRFWQVAEDGTRKRVEIITNTQLEIQQILVEKMETSLGALGHVTFKGKAGTARVNPQVAKLMRLFSEEFPCWFDGCEKMRADYLADYTAAQERAAESGGTCSGCELNSIYDKYITKMIDMGVTPPE